MPVSRRSGIAAKAKLFAALGDETRLNLVSSLGNGERKSISDLTEGTKLTRQAVTKHLRVLERARIVSPSRAGRESRFKLDPQPIHELSVYLESVARQWEAALARLKDMIEG